MLSVLSIDPASMEWILDNDISTTVRFRSSEIRSLFVRVGQDTRTDFTRLTTRLTRLTRLTTCLASHSSHDRGPPRIIAVDNRGAVPADPLAA